MRQHEPVSTRLIPAHTLTEQLEAAPLMNRVDSKYLLSREDLARLITKLPRHYSILETGDTRWFTYDTLYFDTPDRHFYRAHHNGKLNRYKVRTRHYREAGLTFLEVKHKNNQKRTIKHRIELVGEKPMPTEPDIDQFLANTAGLSAAGMLPTLFVRYRRATLMNRQAEERITIDVDLQFCCPNTGKSIALPHHALVEAKCTAKQSASEMAKHLKFLGVRPTRFSKYCIGSALLNPTAIKANRFKPVLDQLHVSQPTLSNTLASRKDVIWNPLLTPTLLSA